MIGSFRHLRGLLVSNVFLLDGGRGDRWLIDCGHWTERLTLLLELRRAGLRPGDLTGVLLTHLHSDHAGNARWLQRNYGVRIHAHRRDAETLARADRARMVRGEGSRIAGLIAEFENHWPARLDVDRVLEDGEQVAGLEVHWIPGHTDGSVFYRHEGTRALLSGDSLLTAIPPLVLRRGFALPYPTFSADLPRAIDSVRDFHARGVPYDHLLPGHGPPIVGGARDAALDFLRARGVA